MHDFLILPAGSTAACHYASVFLSEQGVPVSDRPSAEATHLLLDIPSFRDDGRLRSGTDIRELLNSLPPNITIIGGNLNHPALTGYTTVDLLSSEDYLCQNAAITAHCALTVALTELKCILAESPSLVIGWGRIGKCLAFLLKQNGSDVWLSIRNPKERPMAQALGYRTLLPTQDPPSPEQIRLIFNTAPQKVFSKDRLAKYTHCAKIDLASIQGLEDDDVIIARGLPGRYAPESSGKLIGQTILKLLKEE